MKRGLLELGFGFRCSLGLCTGRPGADAGEWKRYTSFGV